jgi:anti-sigma B factor antagonist
MTALTSQQALLAVSGSRGCVPRDGAEQDQMTVAVAVWPVKLRQVSAPGRGDVAVLGLRGEPDLRGAAALQACLSDIRRQARARCIVDLTGLAFIDCSCLSVLVRHGKMIRGQGGSFALAGPQPAVLRILAVTGLLTWFEVHDTVEEAVAGAVAWCPA